MAWAVLGVGMAVGLYDPAFATLTGLYGRAARGPITGITLIAGFASTVGWPLSAFFDASWMARCVPDLGGAAHRDRTALEPAADPARAAPPHARDRRRSSPAPRAAMPILAFVFAATWFVTGAMAAHLPHLLEIAGASATAAIAAAALVGRRRSAARLVEFGALRMVHPLVSRRVFATLLHPIGAIVLAVVGPGAITAFAVLHGAGGQTEPRNLLILLQPA